MNDGDLPKQTSSNLNTLLLGITIAVMATVGAMSLNNAVSLGRIEAGQVTRPEIETKLAEIRRDQSVLQVQANRQEINISELNLRIKNLERIP